MRVELARQVVVSGGDPRVPPAVVALMHALGKPSDQPHLARDLFEEARKLGVPDTGALEEQLALSVHPAPPSSSPPSRGPSASREHVQRRLVEAVGDVASEFNLAPRERRRWRQQLEAAIDRAVAVGEGDRVRMSLLFEELAPLVLSGLQGDQTLLGKMMPEWLRLDDPVRVERGFAWLTLMGR